VKYIQILLSSFTPSEEETAEKRTQVISQGRTLHLGSAFRLRSNA